MIGTFAGGGFALAGVALQQAFAMRSERRRFQRERIAHREDQCTQALADLVVAGRRVQRALGDRAEKTVGAQERLAVEVDRLAESSALVRVLVTDASLIEGVEEFEDSAKRLQGRPLNSEEVLRLTPLIALIQTYISGRMVTR